MINSRKLEDLNPKVKKMTELFIDKCKEKNIDLLITSTYRDNESQNELYKIGRSIIGANANFKRPFGSKVTNAKGGQSFHNYRVAIDVVPVVNGKAIWNDDKLWSIIGTIGKSIGFFWANDWINFPEKPHFQYTGKQNNYSLALQHFKNGGKLEELE